jgi:hypothetical protein
MLLEHHFIKPFMTKLKKKLIVGDDVLEALLAENKSVTNLCNQLRAEQNALQQGEMVASNCYGY